MIELERAKLDYTSCYCEENVLRLSMRSELAGFSRCVVWVTNEGRTAAVFRQRAAPLTLPVVWDYHVLLACADGPEVLAFDLDSRLPLGAPFDEYVERAFGPTRHLPPSLWPRFRVVDAHTYATRLFSDRSHMRRADGSFRKPPPPWPAPLPTVDPVPLATWLDLTSDAPGEVVDLEALETTVARRLASA